jgi:hypothetical protein
MLICDFRFLVLRLIIQFHWTCQIAQFLISLTERTIEFVPFESKLRHPLSNQEFLSSPKTCTLFFVWEFTLH